MSDALETAEVVLEPTIESLIPEESSNPFALTDDHEFKAAPELERVDVYRVSGSGEPTLIASGPPSNQPIVDIVPAQPGSPESDFRRCPCIGVMPGRACPRCNCSKWVKTCPKCQGSQFLTVQSRKGAHARTERCGFCMGLGQVAARMEEVRAAQEAASAYMAPVVQERPYVPRSVRLPGVSNARPKTFAERAAAKAVKKRAKRG